MNEGLRTEKTAKGGVSGVVIRVKGLRKVWVVGQNIHAPLVGYGKRKNRRRQKSVGESQRARKSRFIGRGAAITAHRFAQFVGFYLVCLAKLSSNPNTILKRRKISYPVLSATLTTTNNTHLTQ